MPIAPVSSASHRKVPSPASPCPVRSSGTEWCEDASRSGQNVAALLRGSACVRRRSGDLVLPGQHPRGRQSIDDWLAGAGAHRRALSSSCGHSTRRAIRGSRARAAQRAVPGCGQGANPMIKPFVPSHYTESVQPVQGTCRGWDGVIVRDVLPTGREYRERVDVSRTKTGQRARDCSRTARISRSTRRVQQCDWRMSAPLPRGRDRRVSRVSVRRRHRQHDLHRVRARDFSGCTLLPGVAPGAKMTAC